MVGDHNPSFKAGINEIPVLGFSYLIFWLYNNDILYSLPF
jgi:hypothetical protein